jgi:hypothetical protein
LGTLSLPRRAVASKTVKLTACVHFHAFGLSMTTPWSITMPPYVEFSTCPFSIGSRITAFASSMHTWCTRKPQCTRMAMSTQSHSDPGGKFLLETFLPQLHRNVRDAIKLDKCTRKPESTGIVGIAQLHSGQSIQVGWRHSCL